MDQCDPTGKIARLSNSSRVNLHLFVYGSLKIGECNDHVLKKWVREFRVARTRGEMRLRPDNYPALFLQEAEILGTEDYATDFRLSSAPELTEGHEIEGQLLVLQGPLEMLRALDDFEGYFPGRPSEYLRVALSVRTELGLEPCWTYTGVGAPRTDWEPIGFWPPPHLNMKPEPYHHGL